MAAIDKLYVNSYNDLHIFRVWVLTNYPHLLNNMYNDVFMSSEDFYNKRNEYIDDYIKEAKASWKSLTEKGTLKEAIYNIRLQFQTSEKDAIRYAKYCKKQSQISREEVMDNFRYPIANFTHKQNLLLKWRCPIPFVREYLKNNCSIETKWYHKIFFK